MYKLNGIDLSTFGLIPAQVSGSNLSVSGCFDLPGRLGETDYDWGDEDGVEPFVDADDMGFTGRDIAFNALVLGNREQVAASLAPLKSFIASNSEVLFSTPYGDFTVWVKGINVNQLNYAAQVTLNLRERMPTLTGIIPLQGASDNTIDGIPFQSFGLTLLKRSGGADLMDQKGQNYTAYLKESYQKTGRQAKQLQLNFLLLGYSMADFIAKTGSLQAIFASPGLRTVKLDGKVQYTAFAKDGFKVSAITAFGAVAGHLDITLTIITEITI